MKLGTKLIALISVAIILVSPILPSQAQAWPDPQLELVSIASDSSTFYSDGRIRFTLKINRLNGSTYSDTSRVWICPKTNWDGLYCVSGQFLISSTPASSQTEFIIESPFLLLADGDYVITAVSFRNGAVVNDYTLIYPRSGVVTIGGIATTIPLVNLSSGDFTIAPPAPEPTSEPEPEPELETESVAESTPDFIEPNPNETDSGQTNHDSTTEVTETETTPAENQAEPNDEPTTEPAQDSAESNANPEPTSTETATPQNQPVIEQQPVDVEPVTSSEPKPQPTVIVDSTPIVVISPKPDLEPVVEAVIETVIPNQIELPVNQLVVPTITNLVMSSAIGGSVTKVTGNVKLERKVKAGTGKLKLLGSSTESYLTIKLGKTQLARLDLTKKERFLINWRTTKPAKLKLVLTGPNTPELLIDALQQAEKLIANPTFQMRG